MKLPNQAEPVSRNTVGNVAAKNSVTPSGAISCTLCSLLPGTAKTVCQAACGILPI